MRVATCVRMSEYLFRSAGLGLFSAFLFATAACSTSAPSDTTASAVKGASDGGQLTLHFYPRQTSPINYSSPASTALSFANDKRVGHTMVEITCSRPSGEKFELLTGQSGGGDETAIDAGWGLSVLEMSFPGVLQDKSTVQGRLRELSEKGVSSFLRVLVTPAMCERFATFYADYKDAKDYENFGLQLRPRFHEGGGCTSFGVTFLELAGLMTPALETSWKQTMSVPVSLMGDPTKGRKIKKLDVVTRFSWARPGEEAKTASFWEPNIIHAWLMAQRAQLSTSEREHETPAYKVVEDGIVPGLVLDARDRVAPTEAEDPVFKAPRRIEVAPAPREVPQDGDPDNDVGLDFENAPSE